MSTSRSELPINMEAVIQIAETKFPRPKPMQHIQPRRDLYFKNNFRRIHPQSHYIAGVGPSRQEMGQFLEDIAYNPHISICHIIALGTRLEYMLDATLGDFHDYCVAPRENTEYGDYSVDVVPISGSYTLSDDKKHCAPKGLIQSKLIIKRFDPTSAQFNSPKELKVTILEVADAQPIHLAQQSDTYKLALLELFEISLEKYILIHCQAGEGRTGHLILTFEILKNYPSIFSSNDPNVVVDQIIQLLLCLRQQQPLLVHTAAQFSEAIRNAELLYHYGLQMNYHDVFAKAKKSGTIQPGSISLDVFSGNQFVFYGSNNKRKSVEKPPTISPATETINDKLCSIM